MARVVVAMSGGVDSSVTAALLKNEGHDVIGITMQLEKCNASDGTTERFDGCCGARAIADAQRVASKLGIPHYVLDFSKAFAQDVIADFCAEYSRGRTPNPCIRCNQYIKFSRLAQKSKELAADFIATGHYARIEKIDGRYILKKGIDASKDQSYFLYTMTQEQLQHTLMPMGEHVKDEVRQIAHDFDLPVAEKRESQDICFIPDYDYAGFFQQAMPHAVKRGDILDLQGNVLGQHHGIINYTIGQRRGLGIAAKEPLYVLAIDAEQNTVKVGPKQEAYANELIASNVNWISLDSADQPIRVSCKIRYRHTESTAIVSPMQENCVHVKFEDPQMAITPGQAVVFYDGDMVVGGGTIDSVGKPKAN